MNTDQTTWLIQLTFGLVTPLELAFIILHLLLEKNNFLTKNILHNIDHLEHYFPQADSLIRHINKHLSTDLYHILCSWGNIVHNSQWI